MTEEEAEKYIKMMLRDTDIPDRLKTISYVYAREAIQKLLDTNKKQQEEIEKLKKHNKELLRKLKNRVKEVKKLKKYSLYKKEFAKLNKEIEKKDKIIDEIIEIISHYDALDFSDICKKRIINCNECENKRNTCIKQYFERKVEV